MGDLKVRLENGTPGATIARGRNDLIIVVDALRASTTITSALAAGIGSVRPVRTPEECVGALTAGERFGRKLDGMTYDNSPCAFHERQFNGENLVMTTTNGTACIQESALGEGPVLIGCLANAQAVADYSEAHREGRDISIVMAGRRGELAPEDLFAASAIAEALTDCEVVGEIEPVSLDRPDRAFLTSPSGANLVALGREDDVRFCMRMNIFDVVPRYDADGCLRAAR
ncbi:MAG: 2-phosphosulfolactate phosphatase [Gammaproteobacteria bacterium]